MVMDRDDIFSKIQEVLDDALGVDEDEVTPDASLVADLGAESIDFLDIMYNLTHLKRDAALAKPGSKL